MVCLKALQVLETECLRMTIRMDLEVMTNCFGHINPIFL
jgi:hypothetical protein